MSVVVNVTKCGKVQGVGIHFEGTENWTCVKTVFLKTFFLLYIFY